MYPSPRNIASDTTMSVTPFMKTNTLFCHREPNSDLRTEIECDSLPSTPTGNPTTTTRFCPSPCRVGYNTGSPMPFRTRSEIDTATPRWGDGMDDREPPLLAFTGICYGLEAICLDASEISVSPKLAPKHKLKTVVLRKKLELQKIQRRAIFKKIGSSASGPSSPTYDPWNAGYAHVFKRQLLERKTWCKPPRGRMHYP
jgi:hypothetical protein